MYCIRTRYVLYTRRSYCVSGAHQCICASVRGRLTTRQHALHTSHFSHFTQTGNRRGASSPVSSLQLLASALRHHSFFLIGPRGGSFSSLHSLSSPHLELSCHHSHHLTTTTHTPHTTHHRRAADTALHRPTREFNPNPQPQCKRRLRRYAPHQPHHLLE
jgi:hypothetical protein